MKKYLMTGIAAVAISAAFTSCSKDTEFEQITPEMISQANYESAFVSKYGKIDSNHDWGFGEFKKGANARTRATTYMNGNMEKYKNAPTVGDNEETDVEAYVHALTVLPAKAAPSWETYFVTQIHDGNETYNTQSSVDGTNTYVGGAQMDELAFAMQASAVINADGTLQGDWIHINNFNNANNTDWNGNTLVENGGTFDFAYKSSVDSKYHNRWIGIDGALVGEQYKNYYYICFDFEATDDNAYTNISWRDANNTPHNGTIAGGWTSLSDVQGMTVKYWDYVDGQNVERTTTVGAEGTTEWALGNVTGGNKVVNGNNDYTDWIIRLYKAEAIDTPNPDEPGDDDVDVRVLAEDLDLTESYNNQTFTGDFDFNDAVFDVVYNFNGSTWIILRAAGGTWPLTVAGNEVHAKFGVDTNVMVNTGGVSKNPVKINLGTLYTDANDIPVIVTLPDGTTRTLTAAIGKAPHKIAVIPTFNWMSERVSIETVHPNFAGWVQDSKARWY